MFRYSFVAAFLGTVFVVVPALAFDDGKAISLRSPDGALQISFQVDIANGADDGQLTYVVFYHNKPLVTPSRLGLQFEGERTLGARVVLTGQQAGAGDSTYELVTGKVRHVSDHFNSLLLNFEEKGDRARKLTIEARAYNDAVAFRYVLPEQRALSTFRLVDEETQFHLAGDATTYALELPNFRSMYESEYVKLPISAFSNQGGVNSQQLIGLPLLMHVPGTAWMAISEADLRGYSSLYLMNEAGGWKNRGFHARLAPSADDPSIAVAGGLPNHSAWRVLTVADQPGKLIESNAITNLSPPTELKDTSWIHAGRASWDWWNGSLNRDGQSAYTTDTMKYYVDFAQASGFEYMLVDAGWYKKNDITQMNGRVDVPELVRYARSKKVKVWIWLPYTLTAAQMEEAFPLYEQWGVAGLKIDFIERDDQGGIDFYYRAAAKAAEHHLLVDFHGATKPSGLERTFPNVLGYEAVLGLEQSRAGSRDNPDNRLTLPFTRMLAGRLDYTPGGFNNVTEEEFVPREKAPMVMGTRVQQLAMYVVYESPFVMVSDTPAAYKDQPTFQFIKDVPATWDETKVLNGVPGEYVTIARRNGAEWFLGSMANWTERDINVPLSFLGKAKYRAEIYSDGEDAAKNPKSARVHTETVTSASTLHLKLAPGGGSAIRFVPAHE